jgi:hypothetical protein
MPSPAMISVPGAVHGLTLAHAVADGLAAAELHFFAIPDGSTVGSCPAFAGFQRVVLFHLDQQFGVGQAHTVADGGAEDLGVGAFGDVAHHRGPCTSARKP